MMSNLKVASINHPSAGSGGLVISTAGLVSGAGLDLITTSTFSAASSVSVDDCFSSTYDNYRIVFIGGMSQNGSIMARLRSGGTDNSSATTYVYNGTLSGPSETQWSLFRCVPVNCSGFADIYRPAEAIHTHFRAIGVMHASGVGIGASDFYGNHFVNSAFDGITLFPDGGTITGSLRVYGYSN